MWDFSGFIVLGWIALVIVVAIVGGAFWLGTAIG